ncbi:MAG: DUF4388 domain-containing protein [Candidatus Dormibacteria bacterium]
MATAPPLVKLLRQLSSARYDYRSGALDITWDEGKASLYLVFGQPNHATFADGDGHQLEGQEALNALVAQLPQRFSVSPWRSVVIRTESLHCTLEELMEPFAQPAGGASKKAPPVPSPEIGGIATVPPAPPSAIGGIEANTGATADPDFGVQDFPLLPLGQSLWSDAAASVVHLDVLVPKLPDTLIVLTGPRLRAAAVVLGKQIIDAVWVDDRNHAIGESAITALMGAREGTVSGYRLEDPRLAEALTMLWRCPTQFRELRTRWLDADGFISELHRERRDGAVLVAGSTHGVGLFMGGDLIAVYTDTERQPSSDLDRLRDLIRQGDGTLTIRQRAGDRGQVPDVPEASYHAFVDADAEVAAAETPDAGVTTEPAAAEMEIAEAVEPGPIAGEEHEETSDATAQGDGWIAASNGHADGPSVAAESQPLQPDREMPDEPAAPEPEPEPAPASNALFSWAAPPDAPSGEATTSSAPIFFGEEAAPMSALQPVDETAAEPADVGATDYEGVKADLIQIGVLWLGNDDVAPVADIIRRTRPRVDEVVASIERIKALTISGHDTSVIRAMAREMHYLAAEQLCGA